MQSSQSFLALGHLHLHPCGYLRSLTGAGNPLAQAYHRAPAPRRTALQPPGLLLRHFLSQDKIFWEAQACIWVLDMLPLPVQLTPPNLPHQEPVAASLLRHCFSQTRDRQTPWTQSPHKRRGMALAKPPWLFFNVQNVQKIDRYLFYFILPKILAEIFCQNILQDISPKYQERYFAKISRKIFCQHIPGDILPEYPTRYFARISRKILW